MLRSRFALVVIVLAVGGCGLVGGDDGTDVDGGDGGSTAADAACSDPCGPVCCPSGQVCNHATQKCDLKCQPDCTGHSCGPDGCGGVCGYCSIDYFCDNNLRVCRPCFAGNGCQNDAGTSLPPDASFIPADSGFEVPPDSGFVFPDAGFVPPDSGFVFPDAGFIRPDAGFIPPDAGFVRPDAGTVTTDGGCRQISALSYSSMWGGSGGYDSTDDLAFGVINSAPSTTGTDNRLEFDLWGANGAALPQTHAFSSGDKYKTCLVCAEYGEDCTSSGCRVLYFAQGGSVSITRADAVEEAGRFSGTGRNLHMVEWNTTTDLPVARGGCVDITTSAVDAVWDGGTASLPPDAGTLGGDGGFIACDQSCGCPAGLTCNCGGAACTAGDFYCLFGLGICQ